MTRPCIAAILTGFVVFSAGCSAETKQEGEPETVFRTTATVKDIMNSMVDPNADVVWDSVATIITAQGTEDRAPRSDEDWIKVRHSTITLLEATNLLLIPGRHIAKPGEKAEDPKVELPPEQIEMLVSKDRASWTRFAHDLHDATMVALKAVDSKNAEALMDAGDGIDKACENCHLQYWYPNDKKPTALSQKPQ